ncbi:MAG: hypothetical protein KJ967_02810 [Elusimicrobia bacterium]|nr:hypothetical protein [Elusimicrobiota bacterium]
MKMLVRLLVLFVLLDMGLCYAVAQVGFGVGVDFTPGAYDERRLSREEKKEPPKNPMVEKISERFGQKSEELQRLWRRGYGYVELIKILLIVKEVNKDLNEIVKQRDKRVRLSKIAESYGVDYHMIYTLSYAIRSELETENNTTSGSSEDR